VAGGASAAARARRLSEAAEIIVFERGHDPSFANCGLPYYIGGEIEDREKLLVAPKQMLIDRHRLDVRTRQSVEAIDRLRTAGHGAIRAGRSLVENAWSGYPGLETRCRTE
jgi:NADPH-dependent 2,4-dienoyl-CoA reductase/sulfur reductase-like enzyme